MIHRVGLFVAPMLGPLVGELPQVVIQRGEGLAGDHRPVVGGPAPHDGVEPGDDRLRVGPAQGPYLAAQPFPDPSHRRLGRLDQQLAVVAADGETQEVEALLEGDDARLVLVEGQSPGRQPCGELRLDLFGLLPGVAQDDEVSRRGESHPPPLAEPCGSLSAYTAPIVQPSGLRPKRQ